MKKEDIQVGIKVVPFQKIADGWERNFKKYINSDDDASKFLKKNGFLYVIEFDEDEGFFVLGEGTESSDDDSGDFFNPEDFEPYEFDKNGEILKAFKNVGIDIKNEDGTLRNYDDVREELEYLWDKL